MRKEVLVTGATGQQGGLVARNLLAKGHRVRAFVRNTESDASQELLELGATLAEGDFNDVKSIRAAVEGVDTVHIVTNMYEGIDKETPQGIRVVDAAVDAGVEHIVLSSVAGANTNSDVPHFESKFSVEQHLERVARNWSIVAPVFFMENFVLPWNLPTLKAGKIRQAIGESTPLQMISSTDIGAFIAHVIDQGESFYGKRVEIAGDSLTGPQIAGAIAATSNESIVFEEQPRDEVAAFGEDVALMFDWFEQVGYDVNIEALHARYPEISWTSFEQWTTKQDWQSLLAKEEQTASV